MTVQELIQELSKYEPDWMVSVSGNEPVILVRTEKDETGKDYALILLEPEGWD